MSPTKRSPTFDAWESTVWEIFCDFLVWRTISATSSIFRISSIRHLLTMPPILSNFTRSGQSHAYNSGICPFGSIIWQTPSSIPQLSRSGQIPRRIEELLPGFAPHDKVNSDSPRPTIVLHGRNRQFKEPLRLTSFVPPSCTKEPDSTAHQKLLQHDSTPLLPFLLSQPSLFQI